MKLVISCLLILSLGVCTGAADAEQQPSETPNPKEEDSNMMLFSVIEKWFDVAKGTVNSSVMVTKAKRIYGVSTDYLENVYDWTVNTVKTHWKKLTE